MRTVDRTEDGEGLSREAWLREVEEITKEIRRKVGELKFDVVEMLRGSREEH